MEKLTQFGSEIQANTKNISNVLLFPYFLHHFDGALLKTLNIYYIFLFIATRKMNMWNFANAVK